MNKNILLVVGITILFLGLAIQPSVAIIQPEEEIDIEPKYYIFQTNIDIANNPDVKSLLENYNHNMINSDYDYKSIFTKLLFRNPRLLFNVLITRASITYNSPYKFQNKDIEITNISQIQKNGFGLIWETTYGGKFKDEALSIDKTADGNYIISGRTRLSDNGRWDIFLLKLDKNGEKLWEKTWGNASYNEQASCTQQTYSDPGFIITGREFTTHNKSKLLLLKLNPSGEIDWEVKIDTPGMPDMGNCVRETNDGGYIVAGGGRGQEDWWDSDIWIFKTNNMGNILWEINITGSPNGLDEAWAIESTSDGGYIATGSIDIDGLLQCFLLKLDADGKQEWLKYYGNISAIGYSVEEVHDGYVVSGCHRIDSQPTQFWILKTDKDGNETWSYDYGNWGIAMSIEIIGDKYLASGTALLDEYTSLDTYFVKVDEDGKVLATGSFGNTKEDYIYCMVNDNSTCVAVGNTLTHYYDTDAYILKVRHSGNYPPDTPMIEGPLNGKIKVEYEYNFSLSDHDNDSVYLRVDWGSGTPSKWYGPFDSGARVNLNHTWNKKGPYTIRAQAKDINDTTSPWATLTVTIPRNREVVNSWFYWLFDRFPLLEVIILRAMTLLR